MGREKSGGEVTHRAVCDRRGSPCWAEKPAEDARGEQPTWRRRRRLGPRRWQVKYSAFTRNHCIKEYVEKETRYRAVKQADAERFEKLIAEAQKQVRERYALYELFAKGSTPPKA